MVEWFHKIIKLQYLELDLLIKNQFGRKHPIDWQRNKCVMFKLLLKIDLRYNVPNSEMSYRDFFRRYKQVFEKYIYRDSKIAESPQVYTLQKYYVVYQIFIKIRIGLLALLGSP